MDTSRLSLKERQPVRTSMKMVINTVIVSVGPCHVLSYSLLVCFCSSPDNRPNIDTIDIFRYGCVWSQKIVQLSEMPTEDVLVSVPWDQRTKGVCLDSIFVRRYSTRREGIHHMRGRDANFYSSLYPECSAATIWGRDATLLFPNWKTIFCDVRLQLSFHLNRT